ncbi:coiled-coil domain-containing protein 178 [Lampris incognitus]|uniref:coiled-coil domain-containing protein 178 n=1 Tax=Lampris incognitus TaxID=2546036 RepID=UPI0024B5068A|nr:coiled-coil domain-containing protein 178 [Lampris incognitus]
MNGELHEGEGQAARPASRSRRSVLVRSPSPCVTKAIHHIQELRREVERCQQSGRPQSQLAQDHLQNSKTLSDSDTKSESAELCTKGIGLSGRVKLSLHPDSGPSTLLRKMTDALGEVTRLMERLETNRQNAQEALEEERRTKRSLEEQVDSISRWKQQEHASVIRREHEAYMRDISELRRHLRVKQRKRDQVKEKLLHTEVLNQHLHEHISFVRKQRALIKEKLELENDRVSQITARLSEVDAGCAKAQNDLRFAEKQFEALKLEADKERTSMQEQLEAIQREAAHRLDELTQLKAQREVQKAKLKESEELVAVKEARCAAISQSLPQLEELETASNDRVYEIQVEMEGEVRKTREENELLAKLEDEFLETKVKGEAEVSQMEEALHSKRNTLASLRDRSEEYERKVEDFDGKISESKNAVAQMLQEKKRMLQRIREEEDERHGNGDGQSDTAAQHSAAKARLQEQQRLSFLQEQRAAKAIEELKRDQVAEMRSLAELKTQCTAITGELRQEQKKSALARRELQRRYEEASSATKDQQVRNEELRKICSEKHQTIRSLMEELKEIQRGHADASDRLEREKKLTDDNLHAVKESHTAFVRRYECAVSRISGLTKKSTEYRGGSDELQKLASTLQEDVDELQGILDVEKFSNHSAAHLMEILQSDINNCQRRARQSSETHKHLVAVRQQTMEELKEGLEDALRENAALAQEYTRLQEATALAREEALCVLDKRNQTQGTFNYYTRLSSLQKTMHKALVKYFEQRDLHNQAELEQCQALSQDNDQRMKHVQEEMSEAIDHLSGFIRSLTDDSTTAADDDDDDAATNKRAGPDHV